MEENYNFQEHLHRDNFAELPADQSQSFSNEQGIKNLMLRDVLLWRIDFGWMQMFAID